jgi:hypothetical protein
VLLPVELAAVDDDAADRGAVAADVLGGRVDDDVGAVVERAAEHRRRGVVDDQRHAQFLADGRHLGDREDLQLRVGQRLGVVGAGAASVARRKFSGSARVDEAHLDAHGLEGVGEEVPGAAVEVGGADDVVAGPAMFCTAIAEAAWPEDRQRGDAALQRRHALLQHVAGRVHDAGVDVAQFLQREEVGGMLRNRRTGRRWSGRSAPPRRRWWGRLR